MRRSTMDNNTQDEPIEEGSGDASGLERIAGIVEQVRADVALGTVHDVDAELRKRLADAGIEVGEEELATIRATLNSDGQ